MNEVPEWIRAIAQQTAQMTGMTSGMVPVVIMVQITPERHPLEGDVEVHKNGDVTIHAPTAGARGEGHGV